jgi:ATP-dependent helicase/nuclease subunit A
VGDRKQSIYAFRGADVGVFVATCVELAGERAAKALELPPGAVPLPARATADFFALRDSHRATASLVGFVNAFSAECFRGAGDDVSEARYAPAVESLVVPDAAPRLPGPAAIWLRPPGEARETSRLEDATLATSFIAAAIERAGEDGPTYRFRDFAILAQSNEMLDAAAFALSRAGVPHVVAGRGFFAAREVQDLVAILRWIDRPSDRAALLAVLRGPCAALGDRTLVGLTEPHRGLVTDLERWDSLERRGLVEDGDREALDRARATLRALRRSAERLGPGRTLREAVRAFEIEQTLLLQPRGVQRIANVRKLLLLADEERTVRGLLDRVARAERRAREPEAATFSEDDDAVRLLTIHASKGLAFRVVIVPQLGAAPVRSATTALGVDLRASPAWLATKVVDARGEPVTTPSIERLVARERALFRADRRRLMYVAVTRARERVVFVGGIKPGGRSEPSFGAALEALSADGAHLEVREAPIAPPRTVARVAEAAVELEPPHPPRTLEIAIAPTALQDFHHCARRFELVHLVALPEPTPSALGRFRRDGVAQPSARLEGDALHRVLERIDVAAFGAANAADRAREALAFGDADLGLDTPARERVVRAAARFLASDYARSVREGGAETFRERAFVLAVAGADLTVTLRGAMDLVVVWPNGDVDVVDYKRARGPDARPHALQLDVYAAAAQGLARGRVRAGAVFLGGDGAPAPAFRPPLVRRKLEAHLVALAGDLLDARRADRFPRASPKTCHAIGCGYFHLCHPAKEKRQLALFR